MNVRRVDIGGIVLGVAEAGPADGPPIILLHGFPESHAAWDGVAGTLAAQGFRVLRPDLRGYGISDAPAGIAAYALDRLAADIIALGATFGLKRFDLVGHDWGGVVAWAVTGRYPARVRRMVTIAAPHPDTIWPVMRRHPRQIWRSAYMAFFQLPWLPEAMLRAGNFRLLKGSLVRTSRAGTFGHEALEAYTRGWRRRLTTMLNYYRALRVRREGIGPIGVPALILWGAADRYLGVELAHAAAGMCEDAHVAVRDDATHWLHREEPDWVSAQIAAFCGARG